MCPNGATAFIIVYVGGNVNAFASNLVIAAAPSLSGGIGGGYGGVALA